MQYTVQFTNVNDPYLRYFIVCADKQWGQPGCQPWTGDWVDVGAGQVTSSPISASQTVTAITSSDAGYYYTAKIMDSNGNVVKECQHVDRYSPCVYSISAVAPTPTPTPTPTPAPAPTPTPTPCPSGTSCIDVPICIQAGGTCRSSCDYGCCCQMPSTPPPTQTPTPAPPLAPLPKLPWETIALIGAGAALGGTAIALAARRKRR
jgi:hypothetical protein